METNVYGNALYFMVKTRARHKATETALNNGWRLAAVGGWRLAAVGGWQRLAVGGWRLAATGGELLAVGGPWGPSLTKKKLGFLRVLPLLLLLGRPPIRQGGRHPFPVLLLGITELSRGEERGGGSGSGSP